MSYKILLVDDDQDLVEMLCRYFRLKGYEMLTAVNGLEAVKKSGEGPDLILLDINMPGMDGLEVCRRIRDQVSCPILFLTARVEEQDRVNGLMMGGDDYIVKPFSLKELEARVLAHLRREERHQQFDHMKEELAQNNQKMWRMVEDEQVLRSAIAHDLRTPLTVLKGYQEMMMEFIPEEKLDREADRLVLEVKDDGTGFTISEEEAKQAFTSANPRDDLKHFGLGMYISEVFCKKHGGHLEVENQRDGACVRAYFRFVHGCKMIFLL